MSDRRYARIYYDDLEREYPEVWRDPVLRGDYTLLLAVADRAWPASPEVPRMARPKAVRRLGELGLILLEPPYHYRCRGMDKHREQRRQQAAHAARTRHADSSAGSSAASSANRSATASDGFLPSRAEPNQAEPSPPDARDPAEAYWSLTGRFPTDKPLAWIDDMTRKYGAEAVIRALVKEHTADRSAASLLGRVQDVLRAEARQLDRKEREDEQARLAEKRARPRTMEPWRQELADLIEKQYGESAA